ncbi:MAG: RICIN domain-containing protein [Oscillospiraceae bacterium]|nr:RICIN domain-containing protein [Oscillospiraceae bacterium]
MKKQIIAIILALQIFSSLFFQTVHAIDPSNKNKIFSGVETTDFYDDHILDHIDRPNLGHIQGITFKGLEDVDENLFYKLVVNDKVIGTLKGDPLTKDKKRYIDFRKYNNGNELYAGDRINLYVGNHQDDSFQKKVFGFGNINTSTLDILTPQRSSYAKDSTSGELRFNAVLNVNAPKDGIKYSLINLTKNEQYKMDREEGSAVGDGKYIRTDGISIHPKDEYVLLSEYENVEYYSLRRMGENLMGVNNIFYTVKKGYDPSKSIGGTSDPKLQKTEEYSNEQQYYFEYDGSKGAYKIKQKFSNKSLIYLKNEKILKFYKTSIDYDDHFWVLEKTKTGKYRISNYYDRKIFLTIDNNELNIVAKPFKAGTSQEFRLDNIIPNIIESKYLISSATNKNKVVSVDYKPGINNPNVIVSDVKSYYNIFQQFELKYVESKGAYKLVPIYDTKGVVTWKSNADYNVDIYDDHENADQLWVFEKISNDTYIIANLNDPSRVLNLDLNGLNISTAKRNNSLNQQFILKDLDLKIDGGKHIIKSSANPSKVITSSGSNVILNNREEISPFQEFAFKYIEHTNSYQIINSNSGLALAWASKAGNNVILYAAHSNYNDQLWNFEKSGDGVYTIYSMRDSRYVLNIDQNGKNISVSTRKNSANQKFSFERINTKISNGNYTIRSNENQKKVISKDNTFLGNIVLADETENNKGQQFSVKYIEDQKAYKIINLSNNLALTWAYRSNSDNIFLYEYQDKYESGIYNQLWNFEILNNGSYNIYSENNPEFVLNINKDQNYNDLNINLAKRDGSINQEFVLDDKSIIINDSDYTIQSSYDISKVLSGNPQFSTSLLLENKIEGSVNQVFSVKYIDSKKAYQIIHKNSGLALAWESRNGNSVILYDANIDYADQLWNFEKSSKSNKYIISSLYNPSYVLTTNNDATLIHMALRKSDVKQKFELK